jgi:hypothetical protein
MALLMLFLACGGDSVAPPTSGATDDTGDAVSTQETGGTQDSQSTTDTQDTVDTVDTVDTEPVPCGWPGEDPGNLTGVGNQPGDTFTNLAVVDQCLNEINLWDVAGVWHMLYITGAW